MKELIKIITPTYKRENDVKAFELFGDNLILAVHEFEKDNYKKNYPFNEIMVLPDKIKGNMAKVRNYIKDNCNSKYLVMIDDDVKEIGYHENMKINKMDLNKIMEFIENGFSIAEEFNTALWGINLQADKQFYREYSPISLLSPILGPFSCHIINNKIRYDERLGLNEDYDYFIQIIKKYRKAIRFNKYYYMCGHLKEKGGCGNYRLLKNEIEQAEIMVKKWGSKIVKYDFKKSTNPRINIPLKGI